MYYLAGAIRGPIGVNVALVAEPLGDAEIDSSIMVTVAKRIALKEIAEAEAA